MSARPASRTLRAGEIAGRLWRSLTPEALPWRGVMRPGRRNDLFNRNQGTLFGSGDPGGGPVLGGIVGLAVLPGAPEHADPGPCKDAHGMDVLAAAIPGAGVDAGGPAGGMARIVCKAGNGRAQVLVAGRSKHDAAALAGGVRDRCDA